jgi:Uma2 family endonuclease
MGALTADCRDSIEHLPKGATLVIHRLGWDDYEHLLEDLSDRPHLRISYDCGRLEVRTPLPEHEKYARFIDDVVRVLSEELDLKLETFGSATWKSRRLTRGVEPGACYYVANAHHVIGTRHIDLESDPPPDIVVEVDITNESLSRFPIYAALLAGEIWRYDGESVHFHELTGDAYREVSASRSFPRLTPDMLATAVAQSKIEGQTAALSAFRQRWRSARS